MGALLPPREIFPHTDRHTRPSHMRLDTCRPVSGLVAPGRHGCFSQQARPERASVQDLLVSYWCVGCVGGIILRLPSPTGSAQLFSTAQHYFGHYFLLWEHYFLLWGTRTTTMSEVQPRSSDIANFRYCLISQRGSLFRRNFFKATGKSWNHSHGMIAGEGTR